MAYIEMQNGNGGGMTETVLWTNPNPTTSFAPQTITLSQSVSNFKLFGLYFIANTTNQPNNIIAEYFSMEYCDVNMNKADKDNNIITNKSSSFCLTDKNPTRLHRWFTFGDTNYNSIRFWYGMFFNTTYPSGYNSNNCCVPIKVVGVK